MTLFYYQLFTGNTVMETHDNCRSLLASLSDYVDGNTQDLDFASREVCLEIERHIVNCDKCRIVVDTLRKTISLYHTVATSPTLPEGVRERLYKRLDLTEFFKEE
jgi:predicted anti-sigma-YlaC factor YlaD